MKKFLFLSTAVVGLASFATSTADEGFYAGVIGGANWVDRSDHHCRGDHKAGYLLGFDLGYTLCNDLSVEGEFVYRHNNLDHVKWKSKHWNKRHPNNNQLSQNNSHRGDKHGGNHHDKHHWKGDGTLRGYSIMANLRYDIPIDCCFTPYVKGGIGWARTKFSASGHHWNNNDSSCRDKWHRHNSKSGFAYQVGAGVAFPFWNCTVLDLGYNFLRAQKEINNNSFVAALRFMF